jgi:hypothetical protein
VARKTVLPVRLGKKKPHWLPPLIRPGLKPGQAVPFGLSTGKVGYLPPSVEELLRTEIFKSSNLAKKIQTVGAALKGDGCERSGYKEENQRGGKRMISCVNGLTEILNLGNYIYGGPGVEWFGLWNPTRGLPGKKVIYLPTSSPAEDTRGRRGGGGGGGGGGRGRDSRTKPKLKKHHATPSGSRGRSPTQGGDERKRREKQTGWRRSCALLSGGPSVAPPRRAFFPSSRRRAAFSTPAVPTLRRGSRPRWSRAHAPGFFTSTP